MFNFQIQSPNVPRTHIFFFRSTCNCGKSAARAMKQVRKKNPNVLIILIEPKVIAAERWMAVRAHIFAVPTQRASLLCI